MAADYRRILLLGIAAIFPAAPAVAETGADYAADEAAENPAEIIVTGKNDGYLAQDSVTATKTGTPLIDVPQTITVVTRERLDDQAMRSIADVLRYIPGSTIGQGEANRDQITLRGQNTTADFFVDGMRDDVQYFRSLYNIERVEVLKGPFAMIFGRGGSGGVVNRVRKSPLLGQSAVETSASVNTFGAWDIAGDVNVPVSGNSALRVNAFYEQLDGHRDFQSGERYAVNPYLGVEFGDWMLGLSYEYIKDDRTTDRGNPSLACTQPCTPAPLEGFRDTFFGVPGVNQLGFEAHVATARLDGQLAPGLNWSTSVLYGDYDKFYTNVYPRAAATSPTGTVSIEGYTDPTTRENFIAQSNLVWDLDFGGVKNTILFGLEYADQASTNQRRNAVLSSTTLNLTNIIYPTVTFPALNRDSVSDVEVFSVYLQDQIKIGDLVELVLGLRYDRFEITGIDLQPNPDRPFARTDDKVSPRIGLILEPQDNLSLYASYSQSFLPRSGDQFLNLSTVSEALTPEEMTNYEIGGKWDIKPDLNLTIALFQLDRTNTGVPVPGVPGSAFLTDTRTRGLEVGLTGRILPQWQVSGGYTYQDAHRRNDDTIRLGQVPRHQVAIWNRFDLSDDFGIGLGVVHQSSQFAAIRTAPTVTRLPGFTRFDAAVYWDVSERFSVQANVENLFDESYFSDAHNINNISTGAPINARLTMRLKL